MTPEQQRAVAIASARLRLKQKPEAAGVTVRGVLNAIKTVGQNIVVEAGAGVGGIGEAMLNGPAAGGRYASNFRDYFAATPSPEGAVALKSAADTLEPLLAIPRAMNEAGINSENMGKSGATIARAFGGGEKAQAAGYALGKVFPDAAIALVGGGGLVRKAISDADPIEESAIAAGEEARAGIDAMRLRRGSADADLADKKLEENAGLPSVVVRDPLGEEAVRQGFRPGLVQAVKASSKADRNAMMQMLDVYERGQKNLRYSTLNRPADVIGSTIRKRVDLLRDVNQKAGRDLKTASERLKGQTVDYSGAIDDFIGALRDMGVTITDKGKVITKGSDIEGLKALERGLDRVVTRMWDTKAPDAYDVHRLKRYIDENVSYGGPAAKGLSGKTEAAIKRLRHNLNESLKQFPDYADANMRYSDTVDILREMQQLAGMKTDITELTGDRAFGRVARKVFSNYQSRDQLVSALENLDDISKKYGGKFDDDVVNQALFVQEMERRFGSAASASFQGDIEKAVGRVMTEGVRATVTKAAADKSMELINRMRGVNDEAALKALRELAAQQ